MPLSKTWQGRDLPCTLPSNFAPPLEPIALDNARILRSILNESEVHWPYAYERMRQAPWWWSPPIVSSPCFRAILVLVRQLEERAVSRRQETRRHHR